MSGVTGQSNKGALMTSQTKSHALEIIERSTDPRHIQRACEDECNIVERDGFASIYTFADFSRIKIDRDTAELLS